MIPYLGKIVPRLFRYKYDPTRKIQNLMISIWDSVVSDSMATVEAYYWDNLENVSKNLTSPEQRTWTVSVLAAEGTTAALSKVCVVAASSNVASANRLQRFDP
ncbi:proteasome-associated protein ECM29 homolog [Culex quinquefasciatus]|uniref:proteasome-associated protein ECM29 homolog n=1 Tax=Culex quinquefasciatus TaxID=7176 RepID=UPI0018E358BA|nr:proteasome-associated protein ECM29 homolog [Culex quinquefasciatus]